LAREDRKAKHNDVLGNYIGLDVTGLSPLPNRTGIAIKGGASENIIGGTGSGEGNVISANGYGIKIFGSNTSGNFSITISHLLFLYLTAAATDILGGTSSFSFGYRVDNAQLYLPLLLR
jgi:hypothetical protein